MFDNILKNSDGKIMQTKGMKIMKQFNWKYYFVLLLLMPVLFQVIDRMPFLGALALFMGYLIWILLSGVIFYKYNRKKGVRKEFDTTYEYEMLTMHFWIDVVHKELAVLCLLNPFKIQYFPLNSVEEIEPVVSYAGRKKDDAYAVYFYITINGKKTSVGVASSGGGPLINWDHQNHDLEEIQKFRDVIWRAKSN